MSGLPSSGADLLDVLGGSSLVVGADTSFKETYAFDDLLDVHVEIVAESESIGNAVEAYAEALSLSEESQLQRGTCLGWCGPS